MDVSCYFFFTATATTEIYTLSLHDALPISRLKSSIGARVVTRRRSPGTREENEEERAPTVVPAGNAYFYYRRKSGEAAQNYGIRITISTERRTRADWKKAEKNWGKRRLARRGEGRSD